MSGTTVSDSGERWDLRKALELALAVEGMGTDLYRGLAEAFEADDDLRALFRRLADEEVSHADTFRALLATVGRGPSGAVDALLGDRLHLIASAAFGDGPARTDGAAPTPDEVLQHALAFEKATLRFYFGLRRAIGASAALDALVAEERRHVLSLRRFIARKPLVKAWKTVDGVRLRCRFQVDWSRLQLSAPPSALSPPCGAPHRGVATVMRDSTQRNAKT